MISQNCDLSSNIHFISKNSCFTKSTKKTTYEKKPSFDKVEYRSAALSHVDIKVTSA